MNMLLNKMIRDKQPPEVIEKARRESAARKEKNILPRNTDDPKFIHVFTHEAEKSLGVLEELVKKENWHHKEDDMRVYIIHIHTIKTALANIGKLDLSAVALKLEQAARNGITEIVMADTPLFFRTLKGFLEGLLKAGNGLGAQTKGSVFDREIDGINLLKGLELMDNDEAVYIQVLRSYTDNVRSLLASVKAFDEKDITKYRVAVHGIKGTSSYIFAEQIGHQAEALEEAAKAGNIEYINEHNPVFLDTAWKLINDLSELLLIYDSENHKSRKPEPDTAILKMILNACKRFDMDDLDTAMDELGRYHYDADNGLADWLREAINNMELTKAAEKLAYLEDDVNERQ
jgi:HPt (histidine-containing phosphotransfer) domain-containing protein